MAKTNGIINGVGDNRFDPKGRATKEVALVILNNVLKAYVKDAVVHPDSQEGYVARGREVCYDLKVESFDSGDLHVTMKVIGNTSDTLDLREFGYQHGPQGHIRDLKAYDHQGKALEVTDMGVWYEGWDTSGRQFKVACKALDEILITYTVNKQVNLSERPNFTSYEGYLGADYGVFTGEQALGLFLFEGGSPYINENIHITIDVPLGYDVVTPWYEEEGVYYPNHNFYDDYHDKYGVGPGDNLMMSTIALGRYDTFNKSIGGSQIRVAVPRGWEDDRKKNASGNIFDLMAYYTDLFGKSILDQYLMVYTPDIEGVDSVWAGESVSSQGTNVRGENYKLDMVAHQIFHRWNGFVLGWQINDPEIRSFLKEGSNRYYEGKSLIETFDSLNYLVEDQVNYLENMYATYTDMYARGEIIPMKDARDGDVDYILAWNAYHTGALLWFKLDMKLYEDTGGVFTCDKLMKALDDCSRNEGKEINYELLLGLLKEATGKDYKAFLDPYIFDNQHLSLEAYFEDDDQDKIPNYIEIIRGTDPLKKEAHEEILHLFVKTLHGVDVIDLVFHAVGSREACDAMQLIYKSQVTIDQAFGSNNWSYKLESFRGKGRGYLIHVDNNYHGLPQDIQDQVSLDQYMAIKKGEPKILYLSDETLIILLKY